MRFEGRCNREIAGKTKIVMSEVSAQNQGITIHVSTDFAKHSGLFDCVADGEPLAGKTCRCP
jgi:hypothetical protein